MGQEPLNVSCTESPLSFPIVVVEDNRGLNDLLRLSLNRLNLRAESVYTGREAILRVLENPECLLLMDYFLDDMLGRDVIERLINRGIRVPFIIMTGRGDEKIAVEMMKLDARDYLIKGVELHDQLPRVVKRVLQEIHTERKLTQAEAAVREGEERFRIMFETSRDLLAIFNEDGLTLWSNPQWQECVPVENFLSNDYLSFLHPDDIPKVESIVEILNNKRKDFVSIEVRLRNRQGDYRHLDASIRNIILEGQTYVFVSARDITQRKLSEQSLRESQEKYRDLIEKSQDSIYLMVNSRMELVNRHFLEFFGVSEEQVYSSTFVFTDIVAPRSLPLFKERLRMLAAQKTPTPSFEFIALTSDNREIDVEAIETFFTSRGGTAVQGIIRDISERKRKEAHLQQAAKMEAVGRMASGVAHDFNNLLTIISGQLELAKMKLRENSPIHAELQLIQSATETASEMTANLLTFSRQGEIEPRILSLNEVLLKTIRMIDPILGKNITLVNNLQEDLWNIKVDRNQMEQVIMNLAVNARDAMENGGSLTIATKNMILDIDHGAKVTGRPAGPYVMMTLADTGVGMSEEVKSMIFEPFFTTKGEGRGTGLGLATVYGNICRSGGHVTVDSSPGRGAVFKIFIPAVFDDPELFRRKLNLDQAPRGSESILIAEDDDAVRIMSRRVLELQGYEVFEAESGERALEVFAQQSQPMDLLIADIGMPRMQGDELARHLREHIPHIKILFCSGYKSQEAVSRGFAGQGVHYLEKPFRPTDLVFKVREALDL